MRPGCGIENKKARREAGFSKVGAIVVGIVLVVVFGAFLALAKPAYRWIRERQAASLAIEAAASIEEQNWNIAVPLLKKAYKKSPRNPEVMRTTAKLYGYTDLRRQRSTLEMLLATDGATAEDHITLVNLHLQMRNLPDAASRLEELLAGYPVSREILDTAVDVERARGDGLQVEKYLKRILEVDTEDREIRFQLAQFRTRSPFTESARLGWDEVYSLADAGDEIALRALRWINAREPFYPRRTGEIYRLVQEHPDAREKDVVSALGWLHQLATTPRDQREILERAIVEREGKPHLENREFLMWMLTLREHKRVLELLPQEDVFAAPELLTVYISALIQDEQWDEVRSILDSDDELEESSEVAFIKAQCAIYLKDRSADLRRFLDESYDLAMLDKRVDMLPHIASLAENQGLLGLAGDVFKTMTQFPGGKAVGYERLLRLAKRRKDLAEMRRLSAQILELIPDNRPVRRMAAYLDLLYGINMETAFVSAQALVEELPKDEEVRMILAFAHHRMGESAKARELALTCDYTELTPAYRALYAVIRGGAGDVSQAVSIAEKLPLSLLLEEEVALVRPWLPSARM